jgi:circadian clock protein KaiB
MRQVAPAPHAPHGHEISGSSDRYRFRLYVAGTLPNSQQAQQNLRALCESHLPGRYDIEVIDFLSEPGRGLADGVIVTPTLVMVEPAPQRIVVGNLNDEHAVLHALELPSKP